MANTFIQLNDVPGDYTGHGTEFVRVAAAEDSLVYSKIDLNTLDDVSTTGGDFPQVSEILTYTASGQWRPMKNDPYSAGNGLAKISNTLNIVATGGLVANISGVYIEDIPGVAGTYGGSVTNAQFTVNSKGQIVNITEVPVGDWFSNVEFVANIEGTTGTIRVTNAGGNGATPKLDLVATGVTSGTYGSTTLIPQITVDTYGRISNVDEVELDYNFLANQVSAIIGVSGNTAPSGNISEVNTKEAFREFRITGTTIPQTPIVADEHHDIVTFAASTGIDITTNANADTLGFVLDFGAIAANIGAGSLADFDTAGIANGQGIIWDATAGKFIPHTFSTSDTISVTTAPAAGGGSLSYDGAGTLTFAPADLTAARQQISVYTAPASGKGSISYDNTNGVFTVVPASDTYWAKKSDFSVATAAPSGAGALAYNSATGVYTFTPVDFNATTAEALQQFSVTEGAPVGNGAVSYNGATGVLTYYPPAENHWAKKTDFSVVTNAASGGGALTYNSATGVYSYTPADVASAVAAVTQTLAYNELTKQLSISDGNTVTLLGLGEYGDAEVQSYLTSQGYQNDLSLSFSGTSLTLATGGSNIDTVDLSGMLAGYATTAYVDAADAALSARLTTAEGTIASQGSTLTSLSTNINTLTNVTIPQIQADILALGGTSGNASVGDQLLTLSGSVLGITNGNTVNLDTIGYVKQVDLDADLATINSNITSLDNEITSLSGAINSINNTTIPNLRTELNNNIASNITLNIQNLSLTGTDLSISGGNTVDMSGLLSDYVSLTAYNTAIADLNNETNTNALAITELQVDYGVLTSTTIPQIQANLQAQINAFADDQTLSLVGTTITIADGNQISLANLFADYATIASVNSTVSGLNTLITTNSSEIDSLQNSVASLSNSVIPNLQANLQAQIDAFADDQTLSLTGTTITIADGNQISLANLFNDYATITYVDNSITTLNNQVTENALDIASLENAYGALSGTMTTQINNLQAQIDAFADDQTLSLTGTTITIADGNQISLANLFADYATITYVDNSITTLNNQVTENALDIASIENALSYIKSNVDNILAYIDSQDHTDDQTLTLVGNTLTISGGNSVDLSSLSTTVDLTGYATQDYVNTQIANAALAGGNVDLTGYATEAFVTSQGYATEAFVTSQITAITDSDNQTLSLTNDILSISGGNSVDLSSYAGGGNVDLTGYATEAYVTSQIAAITDSDNQTLNLTGTTLSISGGNSINLSGLFTDTDNQTLNLTGTTLTISNGNSVDLSGLGGTGGGIELTDLSGTNGIAYNNTTGVIALQNTGVSAGSYGDASTIPQISVDSTGRITSVTQVPVSGGGGGSTGAKVERMKLNYNTAQDLASVSDLTAGIASVQITDPGSGDVTITFTTNYHMPPASIMMYGYAYMLNTYVVAPFESSMGLRQMPGGGTTGAPTLFNGTSTMQVQLRLGQAETGASHGFGTPSHAWVQFVMYDYEYDK